MNANIGQIGEGLNRGVWGDWTTGNVMADVVKHHVLLTMEGGAFTEQLKVRVRDCAGDGWSVSGNVLTKTAKPAMTAVLTLDG